MIFHAKQNENPIKSTKNRNRMKRPITVFLENAKNHDLAHGLA